MRLGPYKLPALFIGAALTLAGCGQQIGSGVEQITLQEKALPHPNPTNYEFDAPLGNVKSAIKKAYSDKWREEQFEKNQNKVWKGPGDAKARRRLTMALQSPGEDLFFKGEFGAPGSRLLAKPGNENDAYLHGGTSPVGESKVYFKEDYPLIYFADFLIHLKQVNPQKTGVEIFTYDSSVVTGLDESWSPHGPSFIFVKVPPTTVEQYQILLRIGQQLGVTNMPPLAVPGPDAPVKELTLPRER